MVHPINTARSSRYCAQDDHAMASVGRGPLTQNLYCFGGCRRRSRDFDKFHWWRVHSNRPFGIGRPAGHANHH